MMRIIIYISAFIICGLHKDVTEFTCLCIAAFFVYPSTRNINVKPFQKIIAQHKEECRKCIYTITLASNTNEVTFTIENVKFNQVHKSI